MTITPNTGLYSRENLLAFEISTYDSTERDPQERAAMFSRLGLRGYAALWSTTPWEMPEDPAELRTMVEAEVVAMKEWDIDLLASYLWMSVDDPAADPRVKAMFEAFARHQVRPQIWVSQSFSYMDEVHRRFLDRLRPVARELGQADAETLAEMESLAAGLEREDLPTTPAEQRQRVELEADRIGALAELAGSFGLQVSLYNHNGWFGLVENELEVLARLRENGLADIGLAYNFSHARDAIHDDTRQFPELWETMRPHVKAVVVTGTRPEWEPILYPSQGDSELEMMRIIAASGWHGPVGILTQKWGDAEDVLRDAIRGMEWLEQEVALPGSAGQKPSF